MVPADRSHVSDRIEYIETIFSREFNGKISLVDLWNMPKCLIEDLIRAKHKREKMEDKQRKAQGKRRGGSSGLSLSDMEDLI